MMRTALLQLYRLLYEGVARPLTFAASDAMHAHAAALRLCAALDDHPNVLRLLRALPKAHAPVTAGGVTLDTPLMLAAGFVKGHGFETEADACAAVARGENVIPGWRSVPALVGAVEFGSFTPLPRVGNPGTVLWREARARSLQNRVGLKNPGARAAAQFLAARRDQLPAVYGVNVAVSPGVSDPAQERQDVLDGFRAFLSCGVQPAWFTLNLSCPNTDDDPAGNQTEDKARRLSAAVRDLLGGAVPLWVKIGPDLSDAQYAALLRAFADTGVRAVVATNTLAQATPDNPAVSGGVSGGRLFDHALRAAGVLQREKQARGYPVDVIGGGGVLDGATLNAYRRLGIEAVQYWSALIYRGPLAAALILDEAGGSARK